MAQLPSQPLLYQQLRTRACIATSNRATPFSVAGPVRAFGALGTAPILALRLIIPLPTIRSVTAIGANGGSQKYFIARNWNTHFAARRCRRGLRAGFSSRFVLLFKDALRQARRSPPIRYPPRLADLHIRAAAQEPRRSNGGMERQAGQAHSGAPAAGAMGAEVQAASRHGNRSGHTEAGIRLSLLWPTALGREETSGRFW